MRGTAVAGNAVGATLVVVSALASSAHVVWRRPDTDEVEVFRTIGRDRSYADALSRWVYSGRRGARGVGNVVRGNLLIAGGVGLAAAGGLLSFLGDTTGHAIGLAAGVVVMYLGFVRTTQPDPAAGAAPRRRRRARPRGGRVALSIGTGRRGRRSLVEVYTRQGCGLCATAEAIAAEEAGRAEVRLVDIDTDDELMKRYQVRVPVIVVDGREVAEGQVAPGSVKAALRRARRGRWSQWRRA